MSKTISSLNVNVLGNISGLAKSLGGGAVGVVTGFASKIASAGSQLAGFAGIGGIVSAGLAGAGAAIGGALAVKEQFEAIDVTAKLSDRLGVTTESLVGMQHAASLAGVSSEELTGGFEKMFKKLGEGVNGSKEAVATFDALGLSAAQLQAESPDKAFKDIADKINNIANPAQRAAAAMDVFGKSGQSLLPLLTTGAAGISEAQAEAQKLGLTFSRIDAAKVEQANDAVTRLKGAFTGIARTVTIALAPFVQAGATRLTGWIVAALPTIHSAITAIATAFSNLYAWVSAKVTATVEFLSNAWGVIQAPIVTALSAVWGFITGIWANIYSWVSTVGGEIYDAVASRWEAIVESVTASVMAQWDVIVAVWGAISDIAQAAWDGVTQIWAWGCELVTGRTADMGGNTTATFGTILDSLNNFRDYITTVFYAVEYAIKHWQDYFEMAGTEVDLVVVRTGNQIAYVFTEVIPTYIGYGIAVCVAKFQSFYDFSKTIFENLGGNIAVIFKNLPGLIKGTTSWADVWQPLTKGFEETVIEWPGIADREKGEMEKQLEGEAGWLEDNFAKGLADHITNRTNEAHDAAKGLIKGLKDIFNFKGAKVTAPKIPTLTPKLSPAGLSLSITPEIKTANAVKVGSAEAQLLRYAGPRAVVAAPVASPLAGAGGISSAKADDQKEKADRSFILMQKIEQNTRTPQLATSDV